MLPPRNPETGLVTRTITTNENQPQGNKTMNRSDIGRVRHAAVRTVMPGTTRQSAATAPIGSRSTQYRAAEMQRGAPARRAAKDEDELDEDEKDPKRPTPERDEDEQDDDKDPKDKDQGRNRHRRNDDDKDGKGKDELKKK